MAGRRRIDLVLVAVLAAVVATSPGATAVATAAPTSLTAPEAAARLQQRAELSGSAADGVRRQGGAVAMSGDGHTIAVGSAPVSPGRGDPGRVYVFGGAGADWQLQATLSPAVAPRAGVATLWGGTVAISADGDHIAVGDGASNWWADPAPSPGAVDTFRRVGSGWSAAVRMVLPASVTTPIGGAISLSGDGSRLLIGAPGEPVFTGNSARSAWIVSATAAGGWGRPHAVLPPVDELQGRWLFGAAVALSADGRTAVVGSEYLQGYIAGRADSYRRNAAGDWKWDHTFTGGTGIDFTFGTHSIALSADGGTVVIGSGAFVPYARLGSPRATVFDRTLTGWTRSASFVGSGAAYTGSFGRSVAVSADGATVLVGAPLRDMDYGATADTGGAYRFTRDATGWHWGGGVYPSVPRADQQLGASVGLSADGTTAVLGAPSGPTTAPTAGAAYVFTN